MTLGFVDPYPAPVAGSTWFGAPGMLAQNSVARLDDVKDGLSSTIMIGESAGRPALYRNGKQVGNIPQHIVNGGGWMRPASDFSVDGHRTMAPRCRGRARSTAPTARMEAARLVTRDQQESGAGSVNDNATASASDCETLQALTKAIPRPSVGVSPCCFLEPQVWPIRTDARGQNLLRAQRVCLNPVITECLREGEFNAEGNRNCSCIYLPLLRLGERWCLRGDRNIGSMPVAVRCVPNQVDGRLSL